MKDSFFKTKRIESIDLLRGIVIIIMALDHTRDYFHADAMLFAPLDLTKTNMGDFLTRWISHFCAPTFMFLAGVSAFLVGQRKSKKQLSFFLFTRGLWLIFLELTIVNLAWTFNVRFPFFVLGVIWALGVSMVALSLLVYLPFKVIMVIGCLIVGGHNLLDTIHIAGNHFTAFVWSALHDPGWNSTSNPFHIYSKTILVDYPVLPWIGIIALGYCFGYFYKQEVSQSVRRKWLLILGTSATIAFICLRALNIYGDPKPWSVQHSLSFTILSFLRVIKYPPSLLFILMTLGPAILFLAFAEKLTNRFTKAIMRIGRVPMFFYLIHIYVIHAFAMVAAKLSGYQLSDMVAHEPLTPVIKGYGFALPVVYLMWLFVVLLMYPLCKWYNQYKSEHKEQWWLSYL